ncbi:MAG: 50S ribosomal protein L22 [Pirellulales bacterium]|nr:50S ribosomal protein L22 [Pirellulales bacterium]
MAYEASHRFARISARKVRPLANLVRGKQADEALVLLRYQPQRGARMLEKVIKSALGNAEDRRAPNVKRLVVVDCRIEGAPMFKRIRPRARGMAFMIKRRMAHIRVALDVVDAAPAADAVAAGSDAGNE